MNEKQRGRNPSDRKSLRKLLAQKHCVALIWIVIRNQLTNSFLKIYVFISMYWLHIIMGFLMAFSDILIIHFDHIHMLLPSLALLPPCTGSPSSSQGVPFYSRVFAYMNQWVLLELLPKTRAETWARGCLGDHWHLPVDYTTEENVSLSWKQLVQYFLTMVFSLLFEIVICHYILEVCDLLLYFDFTVD